MVFNNTTPELIEEAKEQGLKVTTENIIYLYTGKFTGRSPKDRYFADGNYVNNVIDFNRTINKSISRETYNSLKGEMINHLNDDKVFQSQRAVGYNHNHTAIFKITSTHAWGVLFFNNMTINPDEINTGEFNPFTEWNILHTPELNITNSYSDLRSSNFVIIDFEDKTILVSGTGYTGEIKKSIFTVMNTVLVDRNVLPMHCSANSNGKLGFGVNIFFGLSGTGKTTLSSDPLKFFIGDDEHGWDDNTIFNFEGGCYAKLIDLERDKEPIIWDAIHNQSVGINTSLLENVIVNSNGQVDFTDKSITENIRASYPLNQIESDVKVHMDGIGMGVENIFFLSFDAFGVLPPISLLDNEQAVKFFRLGYTSKVAGTEVGVTEPTTVFSPCFGEPFLPRRINDYADMFSKKIQDNPKVKVWLVNTGFNKDLKRFSLSVTRGIINGVIDKNYSDEYIEYNGLKIPKKIGEYKVENIFEIPDITQQNKFFTMINQTSQK